MRSRFFGSANSAATVGCGVEGAWVCGGAACWGGALAVLGVPQKLSKLCCGILSLNLRSHYGVTALKALPQHIFETLVAKQNLTEAVFSVPNAYLMYSRILSHDFLASLGFLVRWKWKHMTFRSWQLIRFRFKSSTSSTLPPTVFVT